MIKNFIRIAWRNLRKKRGSSIIHIAGLALSVSFCLLLIYYIRYEQSFDSFHEKKDRLFRLEMTNTWQIDTAHAKKKGFFSFLTRSVRRSSSNQTAAAFLPYPALPKTHPPIPVSVTG